jgi:hypothetical protein
VVSKVELLEMQRYQDQWGEESIIKSEMGMMSVRVSSGPGDSCEKERHSKKRDKKVKKKSKKKKHKDESKKLSKRDRSSGRGESSDLGGKKKKSSR